jgi:cytosine/creatinine deaminase
MDLIVRNAAMRGVSGMRDIGVDKGKISAVEGHLSVRAEKEIDARGCLVSPPFVDPHVHLDAVFLEGRTVHNKTGTLLEGIANWGIEKATLTEEEILSNARKALRWYIANGVLKIRTHVDTTLKSLINLHAILRLKEEFKEYVDLQIVAFPQDGIYTEPSFSSLMEKAVKAGCDVIGGIPHNELTREDGVNDVIRAFDLAEKYNCLVDIHCDETGDPESRFIEVMAKETINRKMQGRVTASHATAMHNYNNDYAFKLIGILKRAGINVVTNPFDNSVLQNRNDGYPRYRGHTRVDELLHRGVTVAIGHDSIMDPWYPMGTANMLSAANLFLHYGHFSGYDEIPQLFDMITVNAARVMCIDKDYGIEKGKTADFVILNAPDEYEAIRLESECLFVIRKGVVISECAPSPHVLHLGKETYETSFSRTE